MASAIPDADKPLSYGCLKCILQQLEANFRCQLVARLPKINLAEKAVQLYISELIIWEGGFILNDTNYRLGVIRHAREGPTPGKIKRENKEGGVQNDIDQFGFENFHLPELTPGDILIKEYDPTRELDDNLELAEARLVRYRNLLTDLEREKRELEDAPENPAEENFIESDQLSRSKRLESISYNIQSAKWNLEDSELTVQRYQYKRDNRSFPYDMFIQLTKKSSDGTVYTERFNYNKSLRQAQKYLMSKFLGNRQLATKIKSLCFAACQREGFILGFPEGIRLDVQEIKTGLNVADVLQRVETILEHPNRPFTRLVSGRFELKDAQSPRVRNAEVLVLYTKNFVDCVALCRELPNKRVVFPVVRHTQPEQFGLLVENLIDTKKTLGTCYEFTGLEEKDKAREALRVIAERFETSVVRKRLVSIPLPHQLQLDVSLIAYQFNLGETLCDIKIEVVQSQPN
ncbi:hypothetical protein B9Z55_023322 [Caenorhabditis nigoni]|uniref:Uncharacterized protein n=1 Tax=Caenorhabditis nigoni TaxID=1611254 RepID=A0A2G5SPW7_9PELO|nr:hypothetical protein B9Z55_023322 [Caenorhabditis nigoni]